MGAVGGRGGVVARLASGARSRSGDRQLLVARLDRRDRRADFDAHHDARSSRAGPAPGAAVRGDPRCRGVPGRRRPRRMSWPTPSSSCRRCCARVDRSSNDRDEQASSSLLAAAGVAAAALVRRTRSWPAQPRHRRARRAGRRHVRHHRGAQAVRDRRAARRARSRTRAAHGRGHHRAARQHEGRVDEARPDGQLRQRRACPSRCAPRWPSCSRTRRR